MLIPFRASVPSRRWPLVSGGLVAACCTVFAYQLSLGDRLPELFRLVAFIPARLFDSVAGSARPEPDYGLLGNGITVLTSMFLHGGWLHVVGNLWFLAVFGAAVEDTLGRLRFFALYLGGGVAATVVHALVEPTSTLPVVGASGAIAAVLGAYLVWFPRARVRSVLVLLVFVTVVEQPALLFLGVWFLIQCFQGTLSLSGAATDPVAWFAHIGGFVYGASLALALAISGSVRPRRPQ